MATSKSFQRAINRILQANRKNNIMIYIRVMDRKFEKYEIVGDSVVLSYVNGLNRKLSFTEKLRDIRVKEIGYYVISKKS